MIDKKGFSLVEIMVVLVLIALLGGIAAVSTYKFLEKSKIAKLLADEKTFQEASISYSNDVSFWPPDVYPNEDPGFMAWYNFIHRCAGQDDVDQPYGGPQCQQKSGNDTSGCNVTYVNFVQKHWNGPYLESVPMRTPWGGSYDYEFWGQGNAKVPPGVYLSVRPIFNPRPENGGTGGSTQCQLISDPKTSVPDPFEVKLQEMGIDVSITATKVVNGTTVPDPSKANDQVSVVVHKF